MAFIIYEKINGAETTTFHTTIDEIRRSSLVGNDFKGNKERYSESYSDDKLRRKIGKSSTGTKLLRAVYKLYLLLRSRDTPILVKAGIVAALGYFISPIDLVPDFVPIAGYADDLAVVLTELKAITSCITSAIKQQTGEKF